MNSFKIIANTFKSNPMIFKGVKLIEFSELEKYYKVQLFAKFLKEGRSAKTLYLSPA